MQNRFLFKNWAHIEIVYLNRHPQSIFFHVIQLAIIEQIPVFPF